MKKSIKTLVTLTIVVIFISILLEEENYDETELSFKTKKNTLTASLILPKNKKGPFPVVIFIHGDGATPYDSHGYYRPLWNELSKKGIASFSWNKPGVNSSSGNWHLQTMEDRANEVIEAIKLLQKQDTLIKSKIGAISFSQAGWVIPIVSKKTDALNFNVIVSSAISWMQQNRFTTKLRLEKEGYTKNQIIKELSSNNKIHTTYQNYLDSYNKKNSLEYIKNNPAMSLERFTFVLLNYKSDSTNDLKYIKTPTLAIFGKDDINVDINNTIKVYKNKLFTFVFRNFYNL